MLNITLDMEEIRLTLGAIALAHPDVSYTLRNEVTGRNLVQTKQQSADGAALVFSELFGKDWADKLVPVGSVREPCDKIKTRISISGKLGLVKVKFWSVFLYTLGPRYRQYRYRGRYPYRRGVSESILYG
jgi:hypothetical protein